MKKAYQYIRISEEDQSNFSLSGQEKMNKDFAEKHNIEVVQAFIDDGYSAKNFDRPNWRALEKSLAQNKNKIDYLIVTKYDRLIRNAAEGLAFI
jgi:site-specific DNA recombinase